MFCAPCFCLVCWTRPKKTTADNQYLKVTSSGNAKKSSKHLTQNQRDASGPSADPRTLCLRLRNGLSGRGAVKKTFLRKGNRKKRAEVRQIKQEPD